MVKTIDKHQFKITITTTIIILIFIIVTTAQFASWKSEVCAEHTEFDDRITHVGEKVIDMREDIETLNDRANGRDVELATITTKLINIEALLIELKTDLKER